MRLTFPSLLLCALSLIGCSGPLSAEAVPARATATPIATAALPQATSALVITLPPSPSPTMAELPPTPPAESADGTPTASSAGSTPTPTPPIPTPDPSLPGDHYVLSRPIPTGWTDYLDRTYAYGSTSGGKYRPHAGGDFANPVTTPVAAAAAGTVFFAGTDSQTRFGPQLDFYGNVIVLEHPGLAPDGGPLYTLYGHLSEVLVQAGQPVQAGVIIGAVGGTGVAVGGAHLHFEVRTGDPYDYFKSTRNPDLWIRPYPGFGTLAGRVTDANGTLLPEVALTLRTQGTVNRYAWTYAGLENIPDDALGENFTYGDLPEGWYTVTTRSAVRSYSFEVYIEAGRTTWLEITFD